VVAKDKNKLTRHQEDVFKSITTTDWFDPEVHIPGWFKNRIATCMKIKEKKLLECKFLLPNCFMFKKLQDTPQP
jgi:hypothetical protein